MNGIGKVTSIPPFKSCLYSCMVCTNSPNLLSMNVYNDPFPHVFAS